MSIFNTLFFLQKIQICGGVAPYGEEGGGQTEQEQQEEHTTNNWDWRTLNLSYSHFKSLVFSLRSILNVFNTVLLDEITTLFH